MRKIVAIAMLWLTAAPVFAHEDRILPIGNDGTLSGIPATYGPVKVETIYAPDDPGTITRVRLSSPRFNLTLSQCIVSNLKHVTRIQAAGSWHHPGETLPPYASLTFYTGAYDPESPTNDSYSVTFSLVDGRILMGARAWDPLIGAWRTQVINPADKCSHWKALGMRPDNPSKPNHLRQPT